MKSVGKVILGIVVILGVGYLVDALWQSRREVREYKAKAELTESQFKDTLERVDALNQASAVKDERIAVLEVDNAAKKKKLAAALLTIEELQDVEPSQPELEHEPLVINLRSQVNALTIVVRDAQAVIATQDDIIKETKAKLAIQIALTEEWKGAYDREHQLRLSCEGMAGVNKGMGILEKLLYGATGYGVGKAVETVAKLL